MKIFQLRNQARIIDSKSSLIMRQSSCQLTIFSHYRVSMYLLHVYLLLSVLSRAGKARHASAVRSQAAQDADQIPRAAVEEEQHEDTFCYLSNGSS